MDDSNSILKVGDFYARGEGCSMRDTRAVVDGNTYTVLFDRYALELAPGVTKQLSSCTIALPLVTGADTVALESVTTTVIGNLDESADARLSTRIAYTGGFAPPRPDGQRLGTHTVVKGPLQGEFVSTETVVGDDPVFVACGSGLQPHVLSNATLERTSTAGSSAFRIKSIAYKFIKRPCPPR